MKGKELKIDDKFKMKRRQVNTPLLGRISTFRLKFQCQFFKYDNCFRDSSCLRFYFSFSLIGAVRGKNGLTLTVISNASNSLSFEFVFY